MLKLNNSLKNGGGGNFLKLVITEILADGNRLFHCGEIKLNSCHAEFISASSSKRLRAYPSPREEEVGERVQLIEKSIPLSKNVHSPLQKF